LPVLTHSVKLDLPRADHQPTQPRPETVTRSVTADRQVLWNDAPVADAALQVRLREVAARDPQPGIHIRCDREVRYERIAQVMAAVLCAGVLRLGFVTEPGR